MVTKQKKHDEYAVKIIAAINQLLTLDEENEENYIGLEELQNEKNATEFLHALANIAPFYIYTKLTGDDESDILEFNYMANRMINQFARPENESQYEKLKAAAEDFCAKVESGKAKSTDSYNKFKEALK